MPKAEFGIIDHFCKSDDYTRYTPQKYHCVAVDDDLYLNSWWPALCEIDTYNVYANGILQPQNALSRCGITILPPASLPAFLRIAESDPRCRTDSSLSALAELIRRAIAEGKHMIHFGI